MSRTNLFSAVSIAALLSLSAPVLAADVSAPELGIFSAQADVWAGWLFVDSPQDNVDPDVTDTFLFGGDGRVRLDLFDVLSVQGDLSGDDTDQNDGSDYYQGGW